MQRQWNNEAELAELLLKRARAGKGVTLSADTAYFVALKLMTASGKPTHREVVQAICDSKCTTSCYPCSGKANIICQAYGQRVADTQAENASLRHQPG